MNRPSLPLLAVLSALACVAALPAAAADPTDTLFVDDDEPTFVHIHAEFPLDDAIQSQVDDMVRKLLLPFATPGHGGADIEHADPTISVQCEPNEAGQQQCRGVVCFSEGGYGKVPASPGDEGLVSLGFGTDPDGDGWYGPYNNMYVSPGGNCGCMYGVGVQWIVG